MRDTYHDCVPFELLEDAGARFSQMILDSTVRQLAARSGGENVSSGRLTVESDNYLRAVTYAVSFDSRAWTGLS